MNKSLAQDVLSLKEEIKEIKEKNNTLCLKNKKSEKKIDKLNSKVIFY